MKQPSVQKAAPSLESETLPTGATLPSILIVDDHDLVRRNLRSLVESRPGWRVCGEAADGIEAIEKAKLLRPQVVLMDINMPRMDGLEATRVIRRDLPDCNVIIVTQNHETIAREQARIVDAKGSVTKSKIPRELLPAIERVLGNQKPELPEVSNEFESKTAEEWVPGSGALGKLVREFNWTETPLGPIEKWPQALKVVVRVLLTSRFAMWMSWGPELTFLYNDAYAKMTLGKKHPWALGKPSQKVWEEIWDDIGPRIRKVLDTRNSTWDEGLLLFLERSGYREETYHTFSYSPLSDDDGKVAGHLCVVTEETDRVISERRLRTLRSLSAELSQSTTEDDVVGCVARCLSQNQQDLPFTLTYLVDEDGKHARLACHTGIKAGDPAAPDLIELSKGNQTWPISDVLKGKRSRVIDDLAERFASVPSGSWDKSPARAILLPIASQTQGSPSGVMVAALNPFRPLDVSYAGFLNLLAGQIAASITNARAYEIERKRAEALAEVDRAKTMFFSNVSHEFRTPLTLMLAPLEDLLAESGTLAPEQRERLDVAHRNSLRLLKLVNTLLDFSRLEAGRIQACYQPTDLASLTVDLAGMFRSAIERAGLRLIVDCAQLSEPVYVDREMWEKIVFNLLSNAFKFTFTGEIEVSLRRADGQVELAIRDTGTGIPEQELPHLFERFYRVKGAQGRTFEGSGIGLAQVQELANLHRGSVRVSSVLNQGSTFTVSIPLGKDHLPAERIRAERTLESTALTGQTYVQEALRWTISDAVISDELPISAVLPPVKPPQHPRERMDKPPRVLLADDNADMRDYVQRLLGEHYEVLAVGDGETALQSARECRPDLILSDVMMPRLDGLALIQAIRQDDALKRIPVILLSARAGEESRIEGFQSGADDYLVKPFSARELLARVNSQLAMAKIRRESAELEHKLWLDSKLLAAIVVSSDDAIVSKNLDGIITSWNKSAERMFGYTAEEAIGKHITLIIPNDRLQEETDILTRLRRGERVDHFQTVRKRKNGTFLDVSLTISPVRDSTGKVIGASKVARDVSDRKQAEERERRITAEAMAANAKFRAVFEQTTVFAGIMTRDGVVLEVNKLFLDACGYRPEQVLGLPFWDTPWWRNSSQSREKIRAATLQASQGTPYRELLHYSWANGAERLVDFALYPIVDEEENVLFLHPTGVDITDLKRTEENYRSLAETLEAEVRARTAELEGRNADVLRQSEQLRELSWRLLRAQDEERRHIARELHDTAGQTLAVLGMNVAMLVQRASRSAPAVAADAEKIQDSIQQLHREIRTTSYLLHPPLLDESGLYSALSWYTHGLMERSGLEISLSIPEEFGRLPRDMELMVFRLVQECLTNIYRHSESKTAKIRLARKDDVLTVEVQDQGKGITGEKLAEIQSRGSGVGIRGMRERIRQFDGKLNIESSSSGTRILVTIPIPKTSSRDESDRSEPLQAAV